MFILIVLFLTGAKLEKRSGGMDKNYYAKRIFRDISGEESFRKAMIRLEESLVLLGSMEAESRIVARVIVSELEANFELELAEELNVLFFWKIFQLRTVFDLIKELLGKLHLTGVVKFPSIDQKFLSESNATSMINNSMLNLANRLIVIEGIDNGQRLM